ncbi:MAG: glycosyltransferase [Gemmatimonadaceae bacterium]|nr:glycosyltransferase [Gemmatimonadaceae bacterium]
MHMVKECDALVGFGKTLFPLLEARHASLSTIPCIVIALGAFGRGALPFKTLHPFLNSNDTLVVSCSADQQIARAFFPTVRIVLIPFSVNTEIFYPADAATCSNFRNEHGLSSTSQLIFYAGRITVEKNLHTALRVFASLAPHLSDPYFFLAGPFLDMPFNELSTVPVSYSRSLARAIEKLGIPEERVAYLGVLSADQLRIAYSSADVTLNLTLHHDENFGLGQLQSLACGTPVVATGWGGLHDTVRTECNGHRVPVTPTPLGVKVDWWDALNAIYDRLVPPAGTIIDKDRNKLLLEQYSLAEFARKLTETLAAAVEGATPNVLPILPSEFATEFWGECSPSERPHCTYRYDTRSFELYLRLIAYYAGSHGTPAEDANSDGPLMLAAPLSPGANGYLAVGDPLFPAEVLIPGNIKTDVLEIVRLFTTKPINTLYQIETACNNSETSCQEAISWMLDRGLLLRSNRVIARLSDDSLERSFSSPLFEIQTIDGDVIDFLVLRNWTAIGN